MKGQQALAKHPFRAAFTELSHTHSQVLDMNTAQ